MPTETLTLEERAAIAVRQVAELPDRTSPDEWPAAMLVTQDELLEIVRAALEAAVAQRDRELVALHAKLQGAFALLTPEDSEQLGITREMVECERPACDLYAQHVKHAVDDAVAQERAALREIVERVSHWKNHVIVGFPIVDESCDRCTIEAALDAREAAEPDECERCEALGGECPRCYRARAAKPEPPALPIGHEYAVQNWTGTLHADGMKVCSECGQIEIAHKPAREGKEPA